MYFLVVTWFFRFFFVLYFLGATRRCAPRPAFAG
jgi:hypothetical protein